MLTVEEALARVLAATPAGGVERVFLSEASGRVLAEDLVATRMLPPWANSAMDGYAVRAADGRATRRVLETIAAGAVPRFPVEAGTASRIMTGAPVPDGADAIVMVEDTATEGENVTITRAPRPGDHVRRAGADVSIGAMVLERGTVLTPAAVGLAAALGIPSLLVGVRPRVAVLSTGDEVVEPGFELGPGQIHSSNTHALAALVVQAGGVPVDLGNVRDDPVAIGEAFARAAACDVVVSTGGVSVGDFDHVKAVIGGGVEFWRVAMKPGKPLAFGRVGGKPTFGLPGNPVSCMVNFLQFVRPVLRTMLGDRAPFLPVLQVSLEGTLRRQPGRAEFVRVALTLGPHGLVARPAGGHQGSGNVLSMAHAHGFVLVDAAATEVSGVVPVQVFDTSFLASSHAGYAWAGSGTGTPDPCC